jgi:hypothetical protein
VFQLFQERPITFARDGETSLASGWTGRGPRWELSLVGKTNQPLIIWVDEEWWDHPKIKELAEKGHELYELLCHEPNAPPGPADMPDLILSRVSWRWNDKMWDYLEEALKEARKVKRGNKND